MARLMQQQAALPHSLYKQTVEADYLFSKDVFNAAKEWGQRRPRGPFSGGSGYDSAESALDTFFGHVDCSLPNAR